MAAAAAGDWSVDGVVGAAVRVEVQAEQVAARARSSAAAMGRMFQVFMGSSSYIRSSVESAGASPGGPRTADVPETDVLLLLGRTVVPRSLEVFGGAINLSGIDGDVLTAEEDDIAGLGLWRDIGASTRGVDPTLALVIVLLGSREMGQGDLAVGGMVDGVEDEAGAVEAANARPLVGSRGGSVGISAAPLVGEEVLGVGILQDLLGDSGGISYGATS